MYEEQIAMYWEHRPEHWERRAEKPAQETFIGIGFKEMILELIFQIHFKFLTEMPPDESFVLLSQK